METSVMLKISSYEVQVCSTIQKLEQVELIYYEGEEIKLSKGGSQWVSQ